ncbi:MAG TPA: hypothetical protein VLB44_24100 [Kofleriaceae bacterium]|nr:hypothetical protein [Kofleriaceae bacterium]
MRALLLVSCLCAVAHADARLDAHLGGGLEGGTITRKPRPDAVAEVGLAGEWILPGRRVGVGAALETIARPGHDLAQYEEGKLDMMLRVRGDHDSHFGIGAGLRTLTPEPVDGQAQPSMWGVDFIHLDASLPLARRGHMGVAAYFAWTMGCYLGRGEQMTERPQMLREVTCGDTMTTTYVVGAQLLFVDR